jgi:hypothetical protein
MTLLDLVPAQFRLAAIALVIIAASGGSALLSWTIQGWRYGFQLERQARLQADTLNEIARAGAALQRSEQARRLALEQRLHDSDQTHYSEMTHAQENQKRLRDRLATTDLRLSVLLAATDPVGRPVRTTTASGRVVHGTHRAELDPAHAQRIVGITTDGDRGLIALKACQDYALTVGTQQ